MPLSDAIKSWRNRLASGHTETWLKTFIILWAIFIVVLALTINNKWILAAIILYEVLP